MNQDQIVPIFSSVIHWFVNQAAGLRSLLRVWYGWWGLFSTQWQPDWHNPFKQLADYENLV